MSWGAARNVWKGIPCYCSYPLVCLPGRVSVRGLWAPQKPYLPCVPEGLHQLCTKPCSETLERNTGQHLCSLESGSEMERLRRDACVGGAGGARVPPAEAQADSRQQGGRPAGLGCGRGQESGAYTVVRQPTCSSPCLCRPAAECSCSGPHSPHSVCQRVTLPFSPKYIWSPHLSSSPRCNPSSSPQPVTCPPAPDRPPCLHPCLIPLPGVCTTGRPE